MADRNQRKASALACLLGISACLVACGRDAVAPGPDPARIDTSKTDTSSLDTFRVRQDLARLAAALTCLPIPMGTRYFHAPAPKAGALPKCVGDKDIFAIPANPRGILGIDTVTHIDSQGAEHCLPQDPSTRELHARYLFDPACGEAWERIAIEIIPDDLLPRFRILGSGRLRLISGLVADIEAYELDMAMDNSTDTPIFQDARLRLALPDGRSLRLDLVKPKPFRAVDFFPSWGNPPRGEPVMAGPVLFGSDTVGRAILYGDRSMAVLDAAGTPVTPE
jgi:hypothetical protein